MNQELNKYAKNIMELNDTIKELNKQKKLYSAGSVEAVQILHELELTVQDLEDYKIFMRRYFHEVSKRDR
jgi:hypothetical protein